MKLCINCRHISLNGKDPEDSLCGHPTLVSPITGKPKLRCSTERSQTSNTVYPCGKEGMLWEEEQKAEVAP